MISTYRGSTLILIFALLCGIQARTVTGAEESLADALTKVSGTQQNWVRCGTFALCLSWGISEQKFKEAWPGFKPEALPPRVLAELRKGLQGLPEWRRCLKDSRPSGILEVDLFGGGSSDKASKLTCKQLASYVARTLIPSDVLDRDELDAWEERTNKLPPQKRMEDWFKNADLAQRQMLLALTIKTRHEAAYPLLEQDFLRRTPKADAYLLLEISAYVRHRRQATAKFLTQFKTEIAKHKQQPDYAEYGDNFTAMWESLVKYGSMDAGIAAWRQGQLDIKELTDLLYRSVDLPWAYHSKQIEPTSVHRPVMEANLKTLLLAAHKEKDLNRRLKLLAVARTAVSVLIEICQNTLPDEQLPPPRSDAPEWKDVITPLRELLSDNRLYPEEYWLRSTASRTAEVIWELWSRTAKFWESSDDRDLYWLQETISSQPAWSPQAVREVALELLSQPDAMVCPKASKEEVAKLVEQLGDRSAAEWRRELDKLPWQRRLLIESAVTNDAFRTRLLQKSLEFVELDTIDPDAKSAALQKLWNDQLYKKQLDAVSWAALKEWVAGEARAGRHWTLAGYSSATRPGITISLSRSTPEDEYKADTPRLVANLGARHTTLRPEEYHITATAIEAIPPKKRPDRRSETLEEASKRIRDEDDFESELRLPSEVITSLPMELERESGFFFYVRSLPAKK